MTDLNQYIQDAIRTESQITEVSTDPMFLRGIMQTMISAGTMLDQLKKNVFYGKDFNEEKLTQEFVQIISALDDIKPFIQKLSSPKMPHIEETTLDVDPRVFHAIVGIATESVELLEALNKPEFDRVNTLEEVGDISWYIAIMLDALNGDWDQLLQTNIEKLKARFPDKFSSDRAINRDLDTERNILEQPNTKVKIDII